MDMDMNMPSFMKSWHMLRLYVSKTEHEHGHGS